MPRLLATEPLNVALSLAGLVTLMLLDRLVGPEQSLAMLYPLAPLAAGWTAGWRAGAWTALAAVGASLLAGQGPTGHALWSAAMVGGAGLVSSTLASALRAALAQASHADERDYVTGLLNRRAFFEALARASKEEQRPLTVVYLDLDDFGAINRGLGFEAGDTLLRLTAETLVGALPRECRLGRLEGDTFGLFLVEAEATEVERMLKAAREALMRAMCHEHWNTTVSLGSVTFSPPPGSAEDAALAARAQLAVAKRMGRGGWRHQAVSAGLFAQDIAHAPHRVDQPG